MHRDSLVLNACDLLRCLIVFYFVYGFEQQTCDLCSLTLCSVAVMDFIVVWHYRNQATLSGSHFEKARETQVQVRWGREATRTNTRAQLTRTRT